MPRQREGRCRREVLRGICSTVGTAGLVGCIETGTEAESATFVYRTASSASSEPTATSSKKYRLLWDGAHWPSPPVTFTIGTSTFPDKFSTTAVKEAIESAFAAWNTVPETVEVFGSPTYDGNLDQLTKGNGVNELLWSSFDTGQVGRLHVRSNPGRTRLREVDLELNSNLPWSANPEQSGSGFDIQSNVTHELGHCGLRDVNDAPEQTMYYLSKPAETKKRTLESGDVNGWQQLYGTNS